MALAWLEQTGERRYVESETRIGRDQQNNIRLSHPSISRNHALIRRVDGNYVISDLDSANGTFVNEERVYAPRHLLGGDRIRLASVEFVFNFDGTEIAAAIGSHPSVATSISQFLTISGQMDPQNYLEGDLRVVTVLFLDLSGFTAMSENMSPEQVTVVMNQCFQHLTETAGRFGGFVDKYIGDGMMVLFGAPQAHDDDAERAVRAAVAMQHELAGFSERLQRRSGIALQMRVGINTGEVLAGAVGSGKFSAFTVMGDAVNMASRLEEHARVGHILVSKATYALARHLGVYSAVPPIAVRGKTELVTAYEIQGLEPRTIGAEPPDSGHFIGRRSELDALDKLQSEKGHLRSAIVCGPAGSGKSCLLDEFRRTRAQDATCILVRCADFVEQGLREATRRLSETLLEQLGTPAPTSAADDEHASTLAAQISQLTRETTVILVLDRADQADSATLALLERCAALLVDADVFLIVTSRLPLAGHWPSGAPILQLQSFTPDECRQLVYGHLGASDVEAATLDRVARWSRGSPLYVEEIISAGLDAGTLQQVDGVWRMSDLDVRTARRLRPIVHTQLDSLSPPEHYLLRIGSVVGRPWSRELLAAALGSPPALDEMLNHLVEVGMLVQVPDGSETAYTLRDDVSRAVIEASLPQLERRRLHERIALALQRTYDPGRPDPAGLKLIARHFAGAGQHWRGVEYLLRSADLAAVGAAPRAVVEHYRSVLDEAQRIADPHERARLNLEVQERIGDAQLRDGSFAEAQIAFELAAESSASEQRRAELQIKLAVTGLRRGNPRRVLQVTAAVLEQAEVNLSTRARAEALAGVGFAAMGAIDDALDHAYRSLALVSDNTDPGTGGLVHFALGRVQLAAGNLVAAIDELGVSIAIREQADERPEWAESQVLLALAQCQVGELTEADNSVRRALATGASGPPDRWTLANAAHVLGRLLADRGEVTRARRHLASGLRAAEAAAARELALECRFELASLRPPQPHQESVAAVVEELRSVLEAAVALELAPLACRTRIALALTLCGGGVVEPLTNPHAREAAALARQAAVQGRTLGLKLQAAVAQRALATALAQLGYWSHAEREFESARVLLEDLGARVELARTLVASAQAEYAQGSSPRSGQLRARLVRAKEAAEALGLEPDRGTAAQLLAALRE